jgi:hypothetical protein
MPRVPYRRRYPGCYWTERGVGFAEAVRHAGEELASEAGHLVDEARELALAEHDELHVAVGDHRRVARCLFQQGQLAERIARPELGDLAALLAHLRAPLEDHEELVAGLTLGDEGLPGGDRTSSARRATNWRSLREQAAKSGTCWRWSMNASRRAMGPESNHLAATRHLRRIRRGLRGI